VGRPPQELMRGWSRPPICKASKLDHRLGIQATCNLAGKGKKGKCGGHRGKYAKSEKTSTKSLGLKKEL